MSIFEPIIETFKVKKQPHSEVELSGTVPADAVAKYRAQALELIAGSIKVDGFREGHVPQDMALKKVGEMAVLEEAVELLARDLYPELVLGKKLDAVGRPDIRITKLAPGNPVEITITTAVYPEVVLPKNWKSIAAKVPHEAAAEATDEEVTQTVESLRTQRKSLGAHGEEVIPEADDAFAKSLGAFDSLEALREQIKKGISEEKVREAKDKRRGAIIDALVAKTDVDMPRIFVESEIEKIIGRLKDDVVQIGMTFEQYLERTKKTEEDLRNDFKDQAAKRAVLQLLLNKLADEEKIEADEKTVEEEMKHALAHFKDADPYALGIHIRSVLRNEAVLKMLEAAQ